MRVCLALFLSACVSIPSAKKADIHYPTTPVSWPDSPTCLNAEGTPGLAKEVLMGKTRTVVVAGGDNPISDADWADFKPGFGNRKNADRNLLFGTSCFARSPVAPADCAGDNCRTVVEIKGYTWVELSGILAMDCIPADAPDCGTQGVPEGALSVTVTRKCQEVVFDGEEAWFLRGPSGEVAVMHAVETLPPTGDVVLPPGWTLGPEPLTAPLVLHPFGEPGDCYYNILRDHRVQAYHQIAYPGAHHP